MVFSHVNKCYRVIPPRRDSVDFSLGANLLIFRKNSGCYNRYFEQEQRKVKRFNNIGGQLQMYRNLLNVLNLINQKWNTRIYEIPEYMEYQNTRIYQNVYKLIECFPSYKSKIEYQNKVQVILRI